MTIRIAAVGDIHIGDDSVDRFRQCFETVPDEADVLLLAGDLTRRGTAQEIEVLAGELRDVAAAVPTVAVLGNHDHHCDRPDEMRAALGAVDVTVLEGSAVVVEAAGVRLGVAGGKGFGGGFAGACGSDFGEPEMKAFIHHTRDLACRIEQALGSLDGSCDRRVALMHYSPVEHTLQGERLEIYPFLGSYLLAEAVDRYGADLVLHGHAHAGSEKGVTPGGAPVRNVAMPVINRPYAVYTLD